MENVVYEPLKSLGVGDPPTGTRPRVVEAVGTKRGGSGWSRRRTAQMAVAVTAASAVALGAVTSPASAETQKWGYELISPADSRSDDIYGVGVSEDMSTAFVATYNLPLQGQPADGRNITYHTALPRGGAPWSLGEFDFRNGNQIQTKQLWMSSDGSRALYNPLELFRVGPGGLAESPGVPASDTLAATPDLRVVASLAASSSGGRNVLVSKDGQPAVTASVDETGATIEADTLGGSFSGFSGSAAYVENALAADGSSVIYGTAHAFSGDNDEGGRDIVRRVLTPGGEQTFVISDASGGSDADAAAEADFRWATADHSRVFFVTAEGLEAGDTDGERDVYLRDGSAAPVRVSQGETVDGAPTGNESFGGPDAAAAPEWATSTPDGERIYFVTGERLTQDAPVGRSLYERDLVEDRTRFVAPLRESEPRSSGRPYPKLTPVRTIPNGVIFESTGAPAGAPDDGLKKVFRWTRDGGLAHISKADTGAPPSPPADASFITDSLRVIVTNDDLQPFSGGRAVSDDGTVVFFTTAESLVAEDTDEGYKDVYRWKDGEGVSLVSLPGRAPYQSAYLDSSPDGTEVYFGTDESILPGDSDPNAKDIYMAILGGGSAPGKPPADADPEVCSGDACQGPGGSRGSLPGIGSIGFARAGNLLVAADPARPSLSVAKVKTVRGSTATLRVKVPGAGRITTSGKSLRRTERSPSKAGRFAVKIRLSTSGKATLERKKTIKLRVRVAYRASGGQTASRTVSVTFKQPKAKNAAATAKKGGR